MEGRPRITRDEITGEPVATADSVGVLAVTLIYPLEKSRPATLSIKPPSGQQGYASANIGFITYHQKLPVNDFRHLSMQQTIDLDWNDPWYSKFRNKNLWRRFNEPINVFLYVEPFEVRVEIVARPKDLQQWVDLGVEGSDSLPVEIQPELKEKVAAFLAEQINLQVDGKDAAPTLDRIHFLQRTLRASTVIDPAEKMDLNGAVLGAIFVYRTTGLPKQASLTWNLFSPKLPRVRAAATDEAGPLPSILEPDDNVLVWDNFLKRPTIPKLIDVTPPQLPAKWPLSIASIICLAFVIFVLILTIKRKQPKLLIVAALLLAAALLTRPYTQVAIDLPFAKPPALSDSESDMIIGTLLRNVYVAFDFRDDDKIYDTLAQSADGNLLTKIYLDTRKSLELQNQGGARVKVKNVELVDVEREDLEEGGGFKAKCKWNVRGSVGHWGHIHQRTNQYEALIRVETVDGEWKITELELLQEERVL